MSSRTLRSNGTLAGRSMAHENLALEKLIRDGPPDGDLGRAIESARYKVLQQEVKSDTDGMVSFGAGGLEWIWAESNAARLHVRCTFR